MISIHEKILQYFKNHNIGSGVKLTSDNDEEDKNKTQKVEESNETEVVAVEPTSTSSSARKSLVAKLKALDEKLKGSNDEEILQTIEYTPLTEEEIKEKASEGMDLKYGVKLDDLANVTAKKIGDVEKSNENLTKTATEQKEILDLLYKDAEEKVEQSAIKRGISRSSIVQEQIKGLGVEKIKDVLQIDKTLASELKDNSNKISELESDYLTAVNKLNVEKALEISEKIQDLTEKQNKKIEEVLKYNNTVKRQLAEMEEKGINPLVGKEKREVKKQMLEEALNYYMSIPKEQALKEFDEDGEIQLLLGDIASMVRNYVKGGN